MDANRQDQGSCRPTNAAESSNGDTGKKLGRLVPILEFWLKYGPLVLMCVVGAVASSRTQGQSLGQALGDRMVMAAQELGDRATLAASDLADAPALTSRVWGVNAK